MEITINETCRSVHGGCAIRKQLTVEIRRGERTLPIDVLVYVPAATAGPVPLFLLLNFGGNHTVCPDPSIRLPRGPVPEQFSPPEEHRGVKKDSYQVEEICSRGYGLATAYAGDIDFDDDDGFAGGAHALFGPVEAREEDDWGTIAAWAWGLSRILDALETDSEIDASNIAVLGHSRMGKAALWAGAQDERFSLVISNESGCTGAAIARRRQGETIRDVNRQFPHWFCRSYHQYNDREEALPVDQHMLLALMAPRPVYVASAEEDLWADPEGEFLSCVLASPLYDLLGLKGVPALRMPPPGVPIHGGGIGYHLRPGLHALTLTDWRYFLDFADLHFGRHPTGSSKTLPSSSSRPTEPPL